MTLTADEALLVINDMEPVDFDQLELVVVTHGAREYFDVPTQKFVALDKPHFWPFTQGEILLLGPDGREPFGEGRKPGKWSVQVKACATLVEARTLSDAVKAAPGEFVR